MWPTRKPRPFPPLHLSERDFFCNCDKKGNKIVIIYPGILAKQDREGYNTSLCVHLFVGILQKLSLNIPEQREV